MTSPLRLADAVLEALEECHAAQHVIGQVRMVRATTEGRAARPEAAQARYDEARLALVRAIREAAKQPTEDET
jgi:hypothetical protein